MVMRKMVVVGGILLVLAVPAFWVQYNARPFPLGVPKDRSLIALFRDHRHAFQEIAELAVIDAPRHSGIDSLTQERRSEYLRLLHQIPRSISLGFVEDRVTFLCARGGFLVIAPGWSKGIVYLPWGPARQGKVVTTTDKDPGHDGIYLVPIEEKWYLIYQRFDYDDWRQRKAQRSNQSMKPTAPLRCNFRLVATTPCRGLSLSR